MVGVLIAQLCLNTVHECTVFDQRAAHVYRDEISCSMGSTELISNSEELFTVAKRIFHR